MALRHTPEARLFLLILISYAYFHHGASWNQIARVDPILSFVEPGTPDHQTLRIDHFVVLPESGRNTGDWARNPRVGEHYYSNKAPGPSFLGVPIYCVLYKVESAMGAVPESHGWTRINFYLLSLLLTALPAALAAALFFRLLQDPLDLDPRAAALATTLLFLGTALFPYGTQLWGHVSAAAFIVMGLYAATRRRRLPALISGLAMGVAVWMEYSAAIALIALAAMLAGERRFGELALFGLGGLPCFVGHALYHADAFGSWRTLATFYNNPVFLGSDPASGLFGGLQPGALLGLTLSPHHGLFVAMPVLLLVLPGFALLGRGPGRPLRLAAASAILGFLAMNLTFRSWEGGAGLGPRYLAPSLPFYLIVMAPLFQRRSVRSATRMLVLGLGAVSIANMGALAIRSPLVGKAELEAHSPLLHHYRALLGGDVSRPRGMTIRMDGEWTSGSRVVSARNGWMRLVRAPGGGPATAHAFVRVSRDGRVRLRLGWQGRLRLMVDGALALDEESADAHPRWYETSMRRGQRRMDVVLEPAPIADEDATELHLLAFERSGRPLLPRPTLAAPEPSMSGFNLGELLGLSGLASIAPWLVVVVLLCSSLVRATDSGRARHPSGASSSDQ